ncbi:unnamed protein product [Lepeophtheirus salmonis]|uniref:(salmon louse) hypothetical protein n=1 Tax=Lepeophtheirus salmonis TaxID=72036 RepID=A0A7R8CQU3_LEPSM|nr:unnamed protein product [Lepeophtheirus salmonis]CAF2898943.1 unnamed protein product [Lepeophtheirus salmonis]
MADPNIPSPQNPCLYLLGHSFTTELSTSRTLVQIGENPLFGGSLKCASLFSINFGEDCQSLLKLIVELVDYHDMLKSFKVTLKMLEENGFGSEATFKCKIAFDDEKPVGHCLYYYGYSSFKEELFIWKIFMSQRLIEVKELGNCSGKVFAKLPWIWDAVPVTSWWRIIIRQL